MNAANSNATELATTDRLAVATTGLEPSTAATLRATFVPFLERAAKWEAQAKAIVVTSIDQKREMRFARESRLALREIRIDAENARKAAKADALSLSKAVDGAANVVKGIIEPIERYLQTQEDFAKNYEAAEQEKVRAARSETLRALGTDPTVYASLGEATDGAWASILEAAQAAHDARVEAVKQEAEIRAQAERIAAEKREAERQERVKAEAERVAREKAAAEENARLKQEAADREAAAARELAAVKAEAEAEAARVRAVHYAERAAAEREARRKHDEDTAARKVAQEAEEARQAERAAELRKAQEETDRAARALAKVQAEAAQAKADAEQATREREAADAERAALEADAKKPTKLKYSLLARALEGIAAWGDETPDEPHAAAKARHVLEAVGLAPKAAS